MNEIAPSKMTPVEHGVEDGIAWAVCEAPLYGAHNGYVLLPENHPWRGKELQMDDYELVDVHGGVTFGPEPDGWIGFDTLHSGDIWPDVPDFYHNDRAGIDWTVEKVVAETKRLAEQAKAAAA